MVKLCKECESDLDENGHFGGCSQHPTNIAMRERVSKRIEIVEADRPEEPAPMSTTPKFILPEATMILPQETIQKAMEVFFKQAMGLDVEVIKFEPKLMDGIWQHHVTFKGKS